MMCQSEGEISAETQSVPVTEAENHADAVSTYQTVCSREGLLTKNNLTVNKDPFI